MPRAQAHIADYRYGEEIIRRPAAKRKKAARPAERPYLNTRLRKRVAVICAIAALVSTVTVARSEMCAMRGYELIKAQREADQLERENRALELQIAQMRSPGRIKSIAINSLGMTVPNNVYFSAERQ